MSWLGFGLILAVLWAYVGASTIAAIRFARRPAAVSRTSPPVSILKPLHGAEPALYRNLCSFIDQNYPEVQVVFGVRSGADQAVPVARAVIRDRPGRDVTLVIDPRATGSNLKVANQENMLPRVRHDLLVMADSDIRVAPNYLSHVTAPLAEPRVGLVTCLYKGIPTGGLWSQLGAMHINCAFLQSALLGEMLGTGGGCFGATIALRRDVLDRAGGFACIRNELADDHRLGAAVRRLGLATILSPHLVENDVAETSLGGLWRHELRWARTVRAMAPAGFAGSVLTHTVVLSAVAAAVVAPSVSAWYFVLASFGLRWLSAEVIAHRLGLPRPWLWLLPVRDALSFAVFLGSFCGRSVSWRDQLFRVEPSGRMTLEGDKPV